MDDHETRRKDYSPMDGASEGQTPNSRTGGGLCGAGPFSLGQQHAVFPLAEGEVTLSFPAEISVESAQMMASFVNLALKQAEMQAKAREIAKKNEAAN